MKLGLFFETIQQDDRNHLAITIYPSQEEYRKALEEKDPAAIWMEVFMKALQENCGEVHHPPTDISKELQ